MKPTKRPKTKPKIKASRPKGRGKRALTNPSKGKVGIFWVFRKQLLPATFALADGQAYGDAINGLTDHVKYWPRLQQQHPVLRWLEYQDVPARAGAVHEAGRGIPCLHGQDIAPAADPTRAAEGIRFTQPVHAVPG